MPKYLHGKVEGFRVCIIRRTLGLLMPITTTRRIYEFTSGSIRCAGMGFPVTIVASRVQYPCETAKFSFTPVTFFLPTLFVNLFAR